MKQAAKFPKNAITEHIAILSSIWICTIIMLRHQKIATACLRSVCAILHSDKQMTTLSSVEFYASMSHLTSTASGVANRTSGGSADATNCSDALYSVISF